jgi:hypothetical protein
MEEDPAGIYWAEMYDWLLSMQASFFLGPNTRPQPTPTGRILSHHSEAEKENTRPAATMGSGEGSSASSGARFLV